MRLPRLRVHLLSSCALAHSVAGRRIPLLHPTCSLGTSGGDMHTHAAVGRSAAAVQRQGSRGSFPRMRGAASLATPGCADSVELDIGYCTDVEGDLGFWQRYCDRSSVLVQGSDGTLDLAHGSCHFVFGGDTVDKGGRDLAFLHDLLSLKDRHPLRVHFVLGNRDINKMRLAAELAPDNWLPAAQHPGVYWRRDGGATSTPAGFLAAQTANDGTDSADTPAARLRYMLRETMGSPLAFEGRRKELEIEAGAETSGVGGGNRSGPVSDEDVLASFEDSVLSSDGLMRRYLESARLAVRVGSTLFVHGAVDSHNAGFVPGLGRRCADVDEWVTKLNQFAAEQVSDFYSAVDAGSRAAWAPAPTRWSADFFTRPGGGLMSYGMARQPSGERTPTIVYASFLEAGHPTHPQPDVLTFLYSGGIRALVCGHQPHGDAPVLMRCSAPGLGRGGVMVVTADTSFSAQVEWRGPEALAGVSVPPSGSSRAHTPAASFPRNPEAPATESPHQEAGNTPLAAAPVGSGPLARNSVSKKAGATPPAGPAPAASSPNPNSWASESLLQKYNNISPAVLAPPASPLPKIGANSAFSAATAPAASSPGDPFDPFAKRRGPPPKASPKTRGLAVADVVIRDVVSSRSAAAVVLPNGGTLHQRTGKAGASGASGGNEGLDGGTVKQGDGVWGRSYGDDVTGTTSAADKAGDVTSAAEGQTGITGAEIEASPTVVASVRVRGLLSNGEEVEFDTGREPEVGRLREDGWWVKGAMPGGRLLLSRGKGYRVENIIVQREGKGESPEAAAAKGPDERR